MYSCAPNRFLSSHTYSWAVWKASGQTTKEEGLSKQINYHIRSLMLPPKEYEILRSPGSGASLLKTGQVNNYCAMRCICLLNGDISPTFLPLCPGHSRFHLELGRKCIIRFSRKRKFNENLGKQSLKLRNFHSQIFAKISFVSFSRKAKFLYFRQKSIFAKGKIFAFSWAFFREKQKWFLFVFSRKFRENLFPPQL